MTWRPFEGLDRSLAHRSEVTAVGQPPNAQPPCGFRNESEQGGDPPTIYTRPVDDRDAISPSLLEVLISTVAILAPVAVFAASFRRNRFLFGRSTVDSCLIALVSAVFWPVWVVATLVTWRQIRAGWAAYRRARSRDRSSKPPRVPQATKPANSQYT